MRKKIPSSILVYLEGEDTRDLVGFLTRTDDYFCFEYSPEYLSNKRIISLGPEMPLRKDKYFSKSLFVPFLERIPSKNNPSYPEYCQSVGISVDEENVFVLLSTIGRRGPSSFIFEGYRSSGSI